MNIFENIPESIPTEQFQSLLESGAIKIERILSKGHSTPPNQWYDQEQDEWVLVLRGAGIIAYEDGSTIHLKVGDYLHIPARCKHRVKWTEPNQETIWLVIFFNG